MKINVSKFEWLVGRYVTGRRYGDGLDDELFGRVEAVCLEGVVIRPCEPLAEFAHEVGTAKSGDPAFVSPWEAVQLPVLMLWASR